MSVAPSRPLARRVPRRAARRRRRRGARLRPRPGLARSALRCDAFLDKIKKGVEGAIKGDPAAKTQARYQARVDAINAMEPAMRALSDDQLRAKTEELRKRARDGADLDALLVESFATVREAFVLGSARSTQLIGGMILHEGQIAEMRTAMPPSPALLAFLNALPGGARRDGERLPGARDAEWIGQIHKPGLSAG